MAGALGAPSARAIYWNNDPARGVASADGLTDRPDWFVNTHVIQNQSNGSRGTATLLNSEWAITVRHVVQNGGNYSQIAAADQIYLNVGGIRYYADQVLTPDGSSEMALVRLRGGVNGALDATGTVNTSFNETGRYVHVGGYGYWGIISTSNVAGTANGSASFHRAYNIPYVTGGQLRIIADGESSLATNNLLEGIAGPGDSGGPMWGYYGSGAPDASSSLSDWRLVGLTATSTAGTGGASWGGFSNHTRVASFSSWINNTIANAPAPAPATTGPWTQVVGTGLYDTGGAKFSVTGSTSSAVTQAAFGPDGAGYALDAVGDKLTMTAVLDTPLTMASTQFRYGMFDDAGGTIPGNVPGGTPWHGYLVGNAVESSPQGPLEKGPNGGGVGQWWSIVSPNSGVALLSRGGSATGTYDDAAGNQNMPAGRYALTLGYTRVDSGLQIDWSTVSVDAAGVPNGVYSHLGTVVDPTPAASNWNFNQLGFFLAGGSFTGTIVMDEINVQFDAAPPSPADFDADGVVDGADLAIWQTNYGAEGASQSVGDATGDGLVDGADFLAWQRLAAPGAAGPNLAAVPEPTAAALVVLALAGFLSRVGPRTLARCTEPAESSSSGSSDCGALSA
ncbi:MAG: hypothetical protein KF688_14370 [Pirellulales bacterium]|nr:hypothetical protein [Pirellulales bacterium]